MAVDVVALSTDRPQLRGWHPSGREPFATLDADPDVMEHLVAPLRRAAPAVGG